MQAMAFYGDDSSTEDEDEEQDDEQPAGELCWAVWLRHRHCGCCLPLRTVAVAAGHVVPAGLHA